ncbi:MAG: hypothetical protein ACREVQ_02430 [Burkholderiales bacterium]
MRKFLLAFAGIWLAGNLAVAYAKLPPPPPKTDAEKAADAKKATDAKAKDAADLAKAEDRAISNYKKNKGIAEKPVVMPVKSSKKK